MASSPFERQVVETDSADDASPVSSRMSDGPQQYELSPSFKDRDRPAVRLVELPAWLQSFASSVGEPDIPEPAQEPTQEVQKDTEVASPNESAETSSTPAHQPKAAAPALQGVSADFISEDDLPAWLRSIAPEESGDAPVDTFSIDRAVDGEHLPVPNVARAWSSSKDSRGVGESTSLFALVASQTPQHALPDSDVAKTPQPGSVTSRVDDASNVERYGGSLPPGNEPVAEESPTGSQADATAEKKRRLPLLPIIVAVILILVLAGAAAQMFLL